MKETIHRDKATHDGFLARLLFRRLGQVTASVLDHAPISPNQVTVASFILAAGAAGLFSLGIRWCTLLGGVFVFVSYTLDIADGELARLRHQTTSLGVFLDPILDRLAESLLMFAVAFRVRTPAGNWPAIGVIAAAGASLVAIYFYIVDIRPSGRSIGERDNPRVLTTKNGTFLGLIDLFYGGLLVATLGDWLTCWAVAIAGLAAAGILFQLTVLRRRVHKNNQS